MWVNYNEERKYQKKGGKEKKENVEDKKNKLEKIAMKKT